MDNEIKTVAAVFALIRGEITASCVAETFGVTELQVQNWKDIFQVAGVVALTNMLKSGQGSCELEDDPNDDDDEPTTTTRHHQARPATRKSKKR